MVALVVTLTVVVLLLGVLVAGLLRSHADILRALHTLGVGVGDPAARPVPGSAGGSVPVTMGPTLPAERDSTSAPTVAGVTPSGDALAVGVAGVDQYTLLAFLSSGCSTCQGFWAAFRSPESLGLPGRVRLVVVTKGPELEIAAEVAAKAPPRLPVVMSTAAWGDYEVPGAPFFVLVDGRAGRRVGEGVANQFHQVADLVRRAMVDADGPDSPVPAAPSRLDGPAREAANDAELMRSGIFPGDPSLYPRSLDDVFQSTAGAAPPGRGH